MKLYAILLLAATNVCAQQDLYIVLPIESWQTQERVVIQQEKRHIYGGEETRQVILDRNGTVSTVRSWRSDSGDREHGDNRGAASRQHR